MSLKQNIKNGLLSGDIPFSFDINEPTQHQNRQKRYLKNESSRFLFENAKYTTDYFQAEVLGLYENAPEEWTTVYARFADIAKMSAATTKRFDEIKQIIIARPKVTYLKRGTKIKCMGSVWLVTNPANISGGDGNSVVQRCNATWNHMDFYGNVLREPLIVENNREKATAPDSQESFNAAKGYFDVIAQYNKETKQIRNNTRLILGNNAYSVTGFSDFFSEFTEDGSAVRMLYFTIRQEEQNEAIDDMERRIANGKTFSWELTVNGNTTINVGRTSSLTVTSRKCGAIVVSTQDDPISYVYSSSDERVATVSDSGVITGKSEGIATITVKLLQNETIEKSMQIFVKAEEPHVSFTSTIPETISAYQTVKISAAWYEDGEETEKSVSFVFSGADENSYSTQVNGNSVVIRCWNGDDALLTIKAVRGGKYVEAQTRLLGV